jgi:hypothetical protein
VQDTEIHDRNTKTVDGIEKICYAKFWAENFLRLFLLPQQLCHIPAVLLGLPGKIPEYRAVHRVRGAKLIGAQPL